MEQWAVNIAQVKDAISIAEFKYPTSNIIVFLFDQSSGHCAYASDALIAHKMKILDGETTISKGYYVGW